MEFMKDLPLCQEPETSETLHDAIGELVKSFSCVMYDHIFNQKVHGSLSEDKEAEELEERLEGLDEMSEAFNESEDNSEEAALALLKKAEDVFAFYNIG